MALTLIGKGLFEQVQASARRYSLPNRKSHTYPLRGKVVCGCCGHALTRMERKTSYYLCRHSEADERFSCHGLKVPADDLERAVFDTLPELLIEKVFVFPGNRIEIAYKTWDIFS